MAFTSAWHEYHGQSGGPLFPEGKRFIRMPTDAVGKALVVTEHLENLFRMHARSSVHKPLSLGSAGVGVFPVRERSGPPGKEQKMVGVDKTFAHDG